MAGENLDLSTDGCPRPAEPDGRRGRKFVGVHFACCDVYSRIYLAPDRAAYQGNCPRCAKPVLIRVGPGGTDSRFFTAY
jgi:hypothetical protein